MERMNGYDFTTLNVFRHDPQARPPAKDMMPTGTTMISARERRKGL